MRPGGPPPARTATVPRCGFRYPAGPAPGWELAAGHLQGPAMTVTQLRTTPFLWWRQSTERRGRARVTSLTGSSRLDVVGVHLGRGDGRGVRRLPGAGLRERVRVVHGARTVGGRRNRLGVDRLGTRRRGGLVLHDERDRRHAIVLAHVHETEALGVAPERSEVAYGDALHHAVLR